jgi:type I restriction enzyme M protein
MIESLYKQQNSNEFSKIFDNTLKAISDQNEDIYSFHTEGKERIELFEGVFSYVKESKKREEFAKAIINILADSFNFESILDAGYDFFSTIFEHLVKDYNSNSGTVYAEYYTPRTIAQVMSHILLARKEVKNVTCYDPAAGTGTLLMSLAHEIGEDKCSIYSQDISQKSATFLRLNLILNGLTHSLNNAVQGNTLTAPYHKENGGLMKFDYIVSNPPFKLDFSDYSESLKSHTDRFFAGVPNIPKKDKEGMEIYLCFIQHILFSLKPTGKACIVVPSGFTTDTSSSIATSIRNIMIDNNWLTGVIQMPTNIFANTNTSVSLIFIDKEKKDDEITFVDASLLGSKEKIGDIQKTVLSDDEISRIINGFLDKTNEKEFCKTVTIKDIAKNGNLIKPGLYFDLDYRSVFAFCPDLTEQKKLMELKIKSAEQVFNEKTIQDAICKEIIEKTEILSKLFEDDNKRIVDGWKLFSLDELVVSQIGGDWGDESPVGNKTCRVKCIKGTNIPQIKEGIYSDVPDRYILPKNLKTKEAKQGDIIIEISGGSPIQSTGRILFLNSIIIQNFDAPIICSNFNRLLRFKTPELAFVVYSYLDVLYRKGYFFYLENNTTGIKNLLIGPFLSKIQIALPLDEKKLEEMFKKVRDCL